MMSKQSENKREIIARVRPLFKGAGFTKSGYTFNRSAEDGIVQALNFQTARLGNRFTVNLGVSIRELFELMERPGPFPTTGENTLGSTRLDEVLGLMTDLWCSLLSKDVERVVRFLEYALPEAFGWLEERGTRDGILQLWQRGEFDRPVVVAAILHGMGDRDGAEREFRRIYREATSERVRERLRKMADKLEIRGLA
jgi:hypothetical protein